MSTQIRIEVARILGWKIDIEQVPDIAVMHRGTRTIPLYMVKDERGAKWSPSHSLGDVGMPDYPNDLLAALDAADETGLFTNHSDGLGFSNEDDEHIVFVIDWNWEEMEIIASAPTRALAICKAIIEVARRKVQGESES